MLTGFVFVCEIFAFLLVELATIRYRIRLTLVEQSADFEKPIGGSILGFYFENISLALPD